jgi:hypothetical protein
MKLNRLLILALFTLLFTSWLQADTIDPNHFVISLNDNQETGQNDTEGSGSWGPGTLFQGTGINQTPEGGFPTDQNVSCFIDIEFGLVCTGDGFLDPRIGTKLGGLSELITGDFFFSSNAAGGGAFDFQNGMGVPITSLDIKVTLSKDSLPLTFDCNGGTAFDHCGFIITDPPGDLNLDIWFSGGHIQPTIPEPSTWILLGTAACALLGRRAFRRA